MGIPTNISSSWLTVDGKVINPNAPAGGGGPGKFRATVGSLGARELLNPVLPSPDAPIIRYSVPPDPADPEGEAENPPPDTETGVTILKQQQDERNDIDVKVEVLANKVKPSLKTPAETRLHTEGVKLEFPVPEATEGIVTKEKGKFVMKGTITIQISFQRDGDPKELSAYGRGTTEEDKESRDVTMGFHESCHLKDYLTWFKANPLPVFEGEIGMTKAAYLQKRKECKDAYDKYLTDVEENSKNLTDEVGDPKLSEYLAAGPTQP